MPSQSSLDKNLSILSAVREDKEKLERILEFLESQILPEIEEDNDKIEIPKKYEALVHTIADRVSAGQVCQLNMDTLEIEDYPANIDADEWEAATGEKFEPKYPEWKNVLSFEPMES